MDFGGLFRSFPSLFGNDVPTALEDSPPPCPICLEIYESGSDGAQSRVSLACCGQELCRTCGENLGRCPFCRTFWQDVDPLVSLDLSTPMLMAAGVGLADAWMMPHLDAFGIGPTIVLGSMAGAAMCTVIAHTFAQPDVPQDQQMRLLIELRGNLLLKDSISWQAAAAQLLQSLQWFTSPQIEGLPHVFHGSPWRSKAREALLKEARTLLSGWPNSDRQSNAEETFALEDAANVPVDKLSEARVEETRSSSSSEAFAEPLQVESSASSQLWADLIFCYVLWLEYNPVFATLGTHASYASPSLYICSYNRFRKDLRNVISSFAKHFVEELVAPDQQGMSSEEFAHAFLLLGALDYVLSWEVSTMQWGSSDLLAAEWYSHSDFCQKLQTLIKESWEAAKLTKEGEVHAKGFGRHVVQVMAERDVPSTLLDSW